MIRIEMLGWGNIARIIASRGDTIVEIAACYDIQTQRIESYAQHTLAERCPDFDSFIEKDFSLLVEAASADAVRDHLLDIMARDKNVVVLSIGALTDAFFLAEVRQVATGRGLRIHVPSGAVFGLDNIKVARICGLEWLVLRTTKSPRALGLSDSTRRVRIFRGMASEAVRRFPRNINVSAALALAAGIEPEVELWSDPSVSANRHEIEARGAFGSASICTDSVPSQDNPATSYLAALSVLTLLKNLNDPLVVGT